MDALLRDLRHAARRLRRRPAFTLVAVLTLGLGLGGATAIFSVADAVILRPLPFAEPDRLVNFWQSHRPRGQSFVEMSYPAFRDFRGRNQVFAELAGMPSTNQAYVLTGRGEPTPLEGRLVTAAFFTVLGVRPILGRDLVPDDDRAGAPPVVVLSHALWRDRFSADPGLIGQSLVLNDQAHTVVGVMPPGFAYPKGARLWTPLVPGVGELAENPAVGWMSGLGRLRAGVSLEAAQSEMSALVEGNNRERFQEDGYAAVLTPVAEAIFGPTRPALLALLGAVGLVLLIACANVAGLLLVEVAARKAELAVRQSLGASPGSLLRGVLAETLLLAALGCGLGLAVAHAAMPLLISLSPHDLPRLGDAAVDARALGFAFLAALVTALLCGLAPATLLRHAALEDLLRSGGRGVAGGRSPLRSALVVGEVAIAMVLLVGAGLLARSFVALRQVPLGFEPENVLAVDVALSESRYPDPPRWRAFHGRLVESVASLPGVVSAATVTLRPLWGTVGMDWHFTVEGQSDLDARRNPLVNFEAVSPDYFETMGIPVKRGRVFAATDTEGQPGVVVVSESLARRAWPGQDPLGKRLKVPLPGTPYHAAWQSVVGVVADARYREVQAVRHDLYMSNLQANHAPHHLVVRAVRDPEALVPAIREIVRRMDPDQPVAEAVTMTGVVSQALGGPRFAARIFSAFALVAVLLAALGLYGLLAYLVGRRTREIGVRVALGALPRDVRRLVLREGLALTGGGLLLGLAASFAASRLLVRLLFGVGPLDPLSFGLGSVLLAGVAVSACLLPARRATRVDPAVALRSE